MQRQQSGNTITLGSQPYELREPQVPFSPSPSLPALVVTASIRGGMKNPGYDAGFASDMVCEKIGEVPIIVHCLNQLAGGGIRNAVVVTGRRGELIEQLVRAPENGELAQLNITFVHLGEEYAGSFADSLIAAQEHLSDHKEFLMLHGGTVFSTDIVSEIASRARGLEDEDACRVVVENDVSGMVGITTNFLFIGNRPMDSPDRVYQCGSTLAIYSGIGTGLYRCDSCLFGDLARLVKRSGQGGGDVFEAQLQAYACTGRLLQLGTAGRTWFAIESRAAMDYSTENITKIGHSITSETGKQVGLVGLPKKVQRGSHDGGDWSEFDVGKWRSAVFKAQSYHTNLYDDTTKFIEQCSKGLGGPGRCTLVEVGCGTGEVEALRAK